MVLAVPIFREGWVKTNLNAWNGESFLTYFIKSFSDTHLKHLSHQSQSGINEKFTLTVVLGLLLTVFLVLCLGLIIYICKDRTKRKNSPSPSFESEQHQQMVSTLTSKIIVQQILLFFGNNTYTTFLGDFPSKPDFLLYKWEKVLPTRPY